MMQNQDRFSHITSNRWKDLFHCWRIAYLRVADPMNLFSKSWDSHHRIHKALKGPSEKHLASVNWDHRNFNDPVSVHRINTCCLSIHSAENSVFPQYHHRFYLPFICALFSEPTPFVPRNSFPSLPSTEVENLLRSHQSQQRSRNC